jgi:hypothetical protein
MEISVEETTRRSTEGGEVTPEGFTDKGEEEERRRR